MQENDLVLSDVSLQNEGHEIDGFGEAGYRVFSTRFEFWNPNLDCDSSSSSSEMDGENVDSDGDLKLTRRPQRKHFLDMAHTDATRLSDVGLQVWNGSLILCDFILSNVELFSGKTILELGSGVGLVAVCSAIAGAEKIFATDYDENILRFIDENLTRNQHLFPDKNANAVTTKILDWRRPFSSDGNHAKSGYDWTPAEESLVRNADLILAADVIYDLDLNASLFSFLESLCSKDSSAKTVVIALEKRFNFTIEKLDVACPPYENFLQWLAHLRKDQWHVTQIDTDEIPLCFKYERSRDLEIWKLQSTPFS